MNMQEAAEIHERLERLQSLLESVWWNQDNYGKENKAEAWEAHEYRRRFCERHGLPFTSGWGIPGDAPEPINSNETDAPASE